MTAFTAAENAALVAFAGTVTAAGNVIAASLLDNPTLSPPLAAGPLRATVHNSVPAPVIDPLLQDSEFKVAFAVGAFNSTAYVLDTPPAFAVSVAVCFAVTAFTVAVNPALLAFAGTVTAAGNVIAASLLDNPTLNPPLAAGPLRATVHTSVPAPVIDPLLQDSAVSVPTDVGTFNCTAYVRDTPAALAVSIAVCFEVTVFTIAVNAALLAFAGTVTAAGNVTAASLLDNRTLNPPLAAGALKFTVHNSVPAPVTALLLQINALSVAAGAGAFSCTA